MNELKELLQKGGVKQVFERYSVEVGDELWKALYDHANGDSIIEVCVDGDQTFAVFQNSDEKFYRVNFSYSESDGFVGEEPMELVDYQLPETPQFSEEAIKEFEISEDKEEKEDTSKIEDKSEEEEQEEEEEHDEEEEEGKQKYSLEDIPEYNELASKYTALETEFNTLKDSFEQLENEVTTLREFKLVAERKEKEDLISKFYMLNDEDKKDVIDNIDTYSLDEIEAKLSILCVRNKVKFDEDDDREVGDMTFNLDGQEEDEDASIPAWVKVALEVEKKMK